MIVVVAKYLIPKGFRGLTVFPFVFLSEKRGKSDWVLLHHEQIHLRQQLEMLVLPFFIWYLLEYFLRLLYYRNPMRAYRDIGFEKEAYACEHRQDYLSKRSFWRFLHYL